MAEDHMWKRIRKREKSWGVGKQSDAHVDQETCIGLICQHGLMCNRAARATSALIRAVGGLRSFSY